MVEGTQRAYFDQFDTVLNLLKKKWVPFTQKIILGNDINNYSWRCDSLSFVSLIHSRV